MRKKILQKKLRIHFSLHPFIYQTVSLTSPSVNNEGAKLDKLGGNFSENFKTHGYRYHFHSSNPSSIQIGRDIRARRYLFYQADELETSVSDSCRHLWKNK